MIKKNRILGVAKGLVLALALVHGAVAAEPESSVGFWDVLPETVLRPVGFMGFVGGCALFVASTPFTAVASIEAPHDAWTNSFNGFVGGPEVAGCSTRISEEKWLGNRWNHPKHAGRAWRENRQQSVKELDYKQIFRS